MKLEKHFERLCKKAVFADDILFALIDYIMINKNNHYIQSYNLLEDILKQYHKHDKGFKKTRYMFLDDNKKLFRDLRAKCAFYGGIDFVDVKNYPHMFDKLWILILLKSQSKKHYLHYYNYSSLNLKLYVLISLHINIISLR